MRRLSASIFVFVIALSLTAPSAHAVVFVRGASLSGSTFRVLDPQHAGFKASASSTNYRLFSTIGDIAIGSSSATTFGLRSGFLYYPLVIAPALSGATPANGKVTLSWTASVMGGGWSVSGYNVCTKPPAGLFTCEDVGGVTSFMKTGLSNGTTYTFKVQAKESFGEVIAESGQLSAKPSGGGGGGGGGGGAVMKNSVSFHGYAYPDADITILRDGVVIGTTDGRNNGTFDFVRSGMSSGTYTYGFRATDTAGRNSITLSLPLTFTGNTKHEVSNMVIAPTAEFTTADSVSPGQPVAIRGAATPLSRVRISIGPSGTEHTVVTTGIGIGTYEFTLDTAGLAVGGYDIRARTELSPNFVDVSQYSQFLPFGIGVPPLELPGACGNPPDMNRDARVNLVDFSILAFWWKRLPLPASRPFDLNCDGAVRLDDFSILAFHWSG